MKRKKPQMIWLIIILSFLCLSFCLIVLKSYLSDLSEDNPFNFTHINEISNSKLDETPNPQSNFSEISNIGASQPIIATTEPKIEMPKPTFCTTAYVLLYHHIQPMERAKKFNQQYLTVEPEMFESHIKYLKEKGYRFGSAEEVVKAVNEKKKLPAKTIVITIDDAYSDGNEFAFKIAKEYEAKLNFMIPTSFMNKGGYLTWDSLEEMEKSKYANVYNHSHSHLAMNYLSFNKAREEIKLAHDNLEKHLGDTYKLFTYPMGFYNDTVIEALKKEGYKGAFASSTGSSHCDTNLYSLPRIRIGNTEIKNYKF